MIFKKEDTVDSLTRKCNKLYKEFSATVTLAHYKRHYLLKLTMQENFNIIKEKIESQVDENIKKLLLLHFKEQLDFFNKNPFSLNEKDENEFNEKNFPYLQKIEEIENKNKPKVKVK